MPNLVRPGPSLAMVFLPICSTLCVSNNSDWNVPPNYRATRVRDRVISLKSVTSSRLERTMNHHHHQQLRSACTSMHSPLPSIDNECILCCNELTQADLVFPIQCPTSTCTFNFCSGCIRAFQRAASDGYQQASDGSYQLRVRVQCPQCRARYKSASFVSSEVIETVLCLREAFGVQHLLDEPDLSPGDMARKEAFLKSKCLQDIQRALYCWEQYQREIRKGLCDSTYAVIDFCIFSRHLREEHRAPSPTSATHHDLMMQHSMIDVAAEEEEHISDYFLSQLLSSLCT